MRFLTVDELKKQLIIDEDFHDDDKYLESIGDAAEQFVEQHIDISLEEVTYKNDGELPAILKHVMKMIVEYFYANRGSDSNDIPPVCYQICKLYRQY